MHENHVENSAAVHVRLEPSRKRLVIKKQKKNKETKKKRKKKKKKTLGCQTSGKSTRNHSARGD